MGVSSIKYVYSKIEIKIYGAPFVVSEKDRVYLG